MDSDELIGHGHTPQWVQEQQARMSAARHDTQPRPTGEPGGALLALNELGMYGQSMDGEHGWCLCSLCQRPVGGPQPGYSREQANVDLTEHLRIAHGAR